MQRVHTCSCYVLVQRVKKGTTVYNKISVTKTNTNSVSAESTYLFLLCPCTAGGGGGGGLLLLGGRGGNMPLVPLSNG